MRYKVKIKYNGENIGITRWWLVKRSNVVGFQMHREDGPAHEHIIFYKSGNCYVNNYYYLRGHQYRKKHTWENALMYKSYSKNNRGMI
jgi:hypothetical protein